MYKRQAYEEPYTHVQSNAWKPEERIAVLPVLIDTQKDYKILISESDLADYPCMFLKGTGTNGAISVFPKAPLAFAENSDRSVKITQEADYIAKTKGTRNYPWRYFVISKNDKQLIENTMTYKLAEKNQLQDVSWIKPGQVSWEWWNDASPYGPDVNFVSGYNLDTYKYYIDFASKFGIPYIIMDEGWAKSTRDPYTPNPKVDLHELIRYGKEKNVGIVLWLTWLTVENNFDLFKKQPNIICLSIFMALSNLPDWNINIRMYCLTKECVEWNKWAVVIRIIVCIYRLCVMLSVRWIILPER